MLYKRIPELKKQLLESHSPFLDDLNRIEEDFMRMSEFYAMGNIDPQLDSVYESLTKRFQKLEKDIEIYNSAHNSPFFQRMLSDTNGDYTLDLERINFELEEFNIDITMLDLETDEQVKEEKRKQIFTKHHEILKQLFAKLCLSPVLGSSHAETIKDIILCSTTSEIDAQVMVSALLISCLEVFDGYKADILYNVYKESENEVLKQKALVAFVLCTNNSDSAYDLKLRPLKPTLVANIQRQIFYMTDSPRVEQIMQNEIMPDVIKNSEFDFKNNQIIKKNQDKLDDILNPHKDEEMIEKMEETMKRMKHLQDQGSDLFFGGFKHIKQNPFFGTIMNWLCPFYLDHPQLPKIEDDTDNRIISKLIERTPFCESDKYSFMLSMNRALATIPKEMKDMIINGEAQLDIVGSDITRNSAYVRRTYLQDLFRFYQLCYYAKNLHNPFGQSNQQSVITSKFLHLEMPEYDECAISLCKTLRKLGMKQTLHEMLSQWQPITSKGKIYLAFCELEKNEPATAVSIFEEILADEPHNIQALFGLTKACFELTSSGSAAGNSHFRTHQTDALNSLLALYFKNEKDMSVQHTLIKAHLMAGETDKALKLGSELVAEDKAEAFVVALVGVSSLAQGDIKGGVKLLKKSGLDLTSVFKDARSFGFSLSRAQEDMILNILK